MNVLRVYRFGQVAFLLLVSIIEISAASLTFDRLPRTNLLVFASADGSFAPVTSVSNWEHRRKSVLRGMQAIMGKLPGAERRCPLETRMVSEVDCGTYIRRMVTFMSEPGWRVPAYLLVPKRFLSATNKAWGVLALHQTHPAGHKVVVGLGNSPDDEYGIELVQRGFVVIAPPYSMLADYWPDVKALGYQSGTMKSIWDNIRALDLLSALPFVNTNGFAVIGHSLGGHNGIFTAVFDQRIQIVISSCGLDSFVDYKDGNISGWTQDRYMPELKRYARRLEEIPFDFHEVLGALAPRVCFISAPLGDSNFKWRSVDSIASAARPIFALFGVPRNLQVVHPDCGHLFPKKIRERAYEMIEETLSSAKQKEDR